ncbi:MAG: 5-(carboxyamino)imidazole ribonucleotide synthase [Clostridiales bacterium]|jgi:5-(carboxyamino)imidazole ribonucleotide synthase|nr:5-(carboxyamino)imidazole ribonucleotide synthase [Clostridiales bacterium]
MSILSKRIGVVGGGQLGRMMILEAKRLGIFVTALDPAADCPAGSVADRLIVAAFDDADALARLAAGSDVVTYELEHIGAKALFALESSGVAVCPTAKSLITIQDKLTQKQALVSGGVPVPEFMAVDGADGVIRAGEAFGYPFLLKARFGGYDGKGNALVASKDGSRLAYAALGGGSVPLMAEKRVDFVMEISALACRAKDGSAVVYPVAQNEHADGVLVETRVPAALPEDIIRNARDLARRVMGVFGGAGMFCAEMFVAADGGLLVNEVAPRPHNSGHYTIEGCLVNQFEQHIRAIVGLPLGSAELIRPCAMRNILGEPGINGIAEWEGADRALAAEGVKLHVYGKTEVRPGRKMGHVTAVGGSAEEAAERAARARGFIRVLGGERNAG